MAFEMLGFTLSEAGGLLTLQEAHACTGTRELSAHRLEQIEQKISDLEVMRQVVQL